MPCTFVNRTRGALVLQSGSAVADSESAYRGRVLAVQANYYWVLLDILELPAGQLILEPLRLLCTRRARLKKTGQQVMVGDWVEVEEPDWAGGRGAISEVFPRQSCLDRPPVANADQILLVFALSEPELDIYQLSRFLIKAEMTGLNLILCFNKRDLVNDDICQHWIERLQKWGYEALAISVKDSIDPRLLSAIFRHHITVLAGPSGVGKSSLINHLIPTANLRTGVVSGKLARGRHTTRHVELFALSNGGLLADTPGFNQPDIACHPEDLASYFPEIRQQLVQQHCRFSNCLHRDEPGCTISHDWERYPLYLSLLEETEARQAAERQQREPEAAFKTKVAEAGKLQKEPRLQAKKYRRTSRRSTHQALQGLCDDLTDILEGNSEIEELGQYDDVEVGF